MGNDKNSNTVKQQGSWSGAMQWKRTGNSDMAAKQEGLLPKQEMDKTKPGQPGTKETKWQKQNESTYLMHIVSYTLQPEHCSTLWLVSSFQNKKKLP